MSKDKNKSNVSNVSQIPDAQANRNISDLEAASHLNPSGSDILGRTDFQGDPQGLRSTSDLEAVSRLDPSVSDVDGLPDIQATAPSRTINLPPDQANPALEEDQLAEVAQARAAAGLPDDTRRAFVSFSSMEANTPPSGLDSPIPIVSARSGMSIEDRGEDLYGDEYYDGYILRAAGVGSIFTKEKNGWRISFVSANGTAVLVSGRTMTEALAAHGVHVAHDAFGNVHRNRTTPQHEITDPRG